MLIYHKCYEDCGTVGFSLTFNICSHVIFPHKIEIHNIKLLGFPVETLKDKSLIFLNEEMHLRLV